jgi:hypothetical protein
MGEAVEATHSNWSILAGRQGILAEMAVGIKTRHAGSGKMAATVKGY